MATSKTNATKKISWESFTRARGNIEYFVTTYFPVYGLSAEDFLSLMPPLIFIESYVYYADTIIEGRQKTGPRQAINAAKNTAKELENFLEAQGLDTLDAKNEIGNLAEYFTIETNLLSGKYSDELFKKMLILRSSDFRLLHFVLLKLKNIEPRKDVFEALRHFELLVETEEDVAQYEDDASKKSFNSIAVMHRTTQEPDKAERSIRFFLRQTERRFLAAACATAAPYEERLKKMFHDYRKCTPQIQIADLRRILRK